MRSRKYRALLPVLLSLGLLFCRTARHEAIKSEPTVIFPDGFAVSVTLAVSDRERAAGLMFVQSLPDDKGMLFLFDEESRNPFWMKNCLIPLDMVWLDADGRIVDISRNVPPCKEDPCPNYFPGASYRNVLEIRGNLSAEHKLASGDKLVIIGAEAGEGPR